MEDEIRYVKGTNQLDEVILSGVDVHIEQMADDCYWMCFTKTGDDSHDRIVINIAGASHLKRHPPLNGYVTENDLGIKETR